MEEASQSSGGKKKETKVKTEKEATGMKEKEIAGGKKEKVATESKKIGGKKMKQATGGKKEKETGGKTEKAESSQPTKENERMGKMLKKVNMVLEESFNKPQKPKIIVLYYRGIKKRTPNEEPEEPGTSENPIEPENTQ